MTLATHHNVASLCFSGPPLSHSILTQCLLLVCFTCHRSREIGICLVDRAGDPSEEATIKSLATETLAKLWFCGDDRSTSTSAGGSGGAGSGGAGSGAGAAGSSSSSLAAHISDAGLVVGTEERALSLVDVVADLSSTDFLVSLIQRLIGHGSTEDTAKGAAAIVHRATCAKMVSCLVEYLLKVRCARFFCVVVHRVSFALRRLRAFLMYYHSATHAGD